MNEQAINLTVGITAYEPGWEIILRQIGLNWKVISDFDANIGQHYGVIILNSRCSTAQKNLLHEFLTHSGNILSVNGNAEQLLSISPRQMFYGSIPPITTEYGTANDILDIYSYGKTFASVHGISVHHHLNGFIINIPFDVNALMIQQRDKRKNFYSQTERMPNERVSSVSKGTLRSLITSALEYLYHRRNLPFIHTWYFPKNEPTIFTFRIDSDKGSRDEVEELFALSEKYSIPTSWFLDVKSHESWVEYFSKFKSQEIGVHCYDHTVYKSMDENFKNFEKAIMHIRKHCGDVAGASAPRGEWNVSLGFAFEKLGLQYSSEFSFDYDNLPSYPWLGDRFSSVLQLPVHPVCPGVMRRARMTPHDQEAYFRDTIQRKISQHEPVCLYHHPTHHFSDVFENIFRYIHEQQVTSLSYKEYASWWNKRLESSHEFSFQPETGTITGQHRFKYSDVWLRISSASGNETIVSPEKVTLPNTIEETKRTTKGSIPHDIMKARKFDPRHILINMLEMYYRLKE
ncbi:MAG: hypothetical protein AB1728_00265 [Bacteroidota bacterium]